MDFYLFDRTYKIIHFDDLSQLKNGQKIENEVDVTFSQNEVFVLQLRL